MSNTPVPQASILGTTFGDYEVLTLIGRGAAGTVYLARDIKLQRLVALKVLLGSVARNPAAVKTFHREAQAAAPLRHPGIVRIYAAGYLNGIPYIAMEYVEGEPLDRFIRRNGIMKWQQALFIAGQVAQALGCAHAAGVVHRDVKPANMLLDAQGNVRLTDFGIANIQRGPSKAVDDLGFIGTPHYMAPEQCDRAEVTHKADLYALGVVIYQMIAGVLPFEAENAMALVKKITNDEAPRLNRVFTDIPDDVARLVAHLLEKSPDARPESAAQVFETIQRLQQQQGGRSAIPDALSAFIREQAEIKQLSDAYKGPQGKAGRDTGHGSVQATKNFTVRRALLIAAGVIGIAGAVATAVLHPVQAAETVNAVTVWNEGDTVSIALMNTDLEWDSVVWDDKREYALTTVKGVEGSVYGGKSGALGVSLRDGASTALVTPTPITDESNVLRYVMPLAPEADPNSQALWFLLQSTANERAALWEFDVAPTLGKPRHSLNVPSEAVVARSPALHGIAITPDRQRMAFVQIDPVTQSLSIYERAIDGGAHRDNILYSAPKESMPQGLRYAPDGSSLIFAQNLRGSLADVWISQNSESPTLLYKSVLPNAVAFDKSSLRVAISSMRDNVPHASIVRLRDSLEEADLGVGIVAPGAWHPSESLLVCRVGVPQVPNAYDIVLVETFSPHRRTTVARVEGTVTCGPQFSTDGRRVLIGTNTAEGPVLRAYSVETGSKTFLSAARTISTERLQ